MFDIFKKSSVIHVDAFTSNKLVYDHAPILPAGKYIPEWWKKLPAKGIDPELGIKGRETSNMKYCAGFVDLYKKGFMIPFWDNAAIHVDRLVWKEYRETPAPGTPPDHDHPRAQYGSAFKDFHHIKILSPWIFSEKTGAEFAFTPATWSHEEHEWLRILPGVVNYKYQTTTHINCFMPIKKDPYKIIIKMGTPLVHIIPLSEKRVEVKTHLVTESEMMKYAKNYQLSYKLRKRFNQEDARDEQNSKGCPFSFFHK